MLGLYGGTFDPIHFGHINLAIELMEKRQLSKVLFCPALQNPHRLSHQPAPIQHRLGMVKLAIQDIPHFHLLDLESKREGLSFTIDTITELLALENTKSKPEQLCLLMGDDALPGFFKWREAAKIVDLVPIFVASRKPGKAFEGLQGDPKIQKSLRSGITPTRLMDVSGTEIRQRLAKGLYCGHLVPAKVLDYISENHIYLDRF